jgi:hypothetical protein
MTLLPIDAMTGHVMSGSEEEAMNRWCCCTLMRRSLMVQVGVHECSVVSEQLHQPEA